jgi:hypothetical protein
MATAGVGGTANAGGANAGGAGVSSAGAGGTGVTDPGIDGDGDFTIGPSYVSDPASSLVGGSVGHQITSSR